MASLFSPQDLLLQIKSRDLFFKSVLRQHKEASRKLRHTSSQPTSLGCFNPQALASALNSQPSSLTSQNIHVTPDSPPDFLLFSTPNSTFNTPPASLNVLPNNPFPQFRSASSLLISNLHKKFSSTTPESLPETNPANFTLRPSLSNPLTGSIPSSLSVRGAKSLPPHARSFASPLATNSAPQSLDSVPPASLKSPRYLEPKKGKKGHLPRKARQLDDRYHKLYLRVLEAICYIETCLYCKVSIRPCPR